MFYIYSGKKVLVTGHTGFKGSWLVAWLQKLGAEVVGVSLEPNTNPNHFNLLNLDIKSNIIDIRDYLKLSNVIKQANPEIVFHLAAQPLVRESYLNPLETLETNVIGTANVLNACRELDLLKAIIIVTSDKCYDNKEWVWGYRESDQMGGYDPYSASKGCAELITSSYRNSFFNLNDFGKKHQTLIASARAGNVIGGGDWAVDRLVPDIMRATISKRNVEIRNPQATRPWQHVLECLSGYLCLGERLLNGDKEFAQAWNFAPTDDGTATVLDVINRMKLCWNEIQYEIVNDSTKPHEANLLKLDCSKANTILKWKNVCGLEKTISMTTNWYKNFYNNNSLSTFKDIEAYIYDAQRLGLFEAKR